MSLPPTCTWWILSDCQVTVLVKCIAKPCKDCLAGALVAHAYNSSYSGGRDHEDLGSRPALVKIETLSQKYPMHKKRIGKVAQVVECLPA
jgi:hypothetical protein